MNPAPSLSVRGLEIATRNGRGRCKYLVRDMQFELQRARRTALLGESGSGKTLTALAICGLVDFYPGLVGGSILLEGFDLYHGLSTEVCFGAGDSVRKNESRYRKLVKERVRPVVAKKIGLIFQEAKESLDPLRPIGDQLVEVASVSTDGNAQQATESVLSLLSELKLSQTYMTKYPHEVAGGEAQRVGIALALATRPAVLIADEPTSALDPRTQQAVVGMLQAASQRLGTSVLLITHDLDLANQVCDAFAIAYRGVVVEIFDGHLLSEPSPARHPYTRDLLAASRIVSLQSAANDEDEIWVESNSGGTGCPYAERCSLRKRLGSLAERCVKELPPFVPNGTGRVRCWGVES